MGRRHSTAFDPILNVLTQNFPANGGSQSGWAVVEDGERDAQGGVHVGTVAKFFASVPANNFARKEGKLPCMKTLADQVQEFLDGEGWRAPDLARAAKVSRQNIENVLKGTVKSPRHLPSIARVMRTTVDVLVSGRYRFNQSPADEPQAGEAELEHLNAWRGLSEPAKALLSAYMDRLRALDQAGASSADDIPPAFNRPATMPRKRTGTSE
jgi:hypothetical protein